MSAKPVDSRQPLFTFAVVGDTHVNGDELTSTSPWPTNAMANARAASVVAQINSLRPDFVIHLGDMVHPLPSSPGYADASDAFRGIFGKLDCPLHLIPGNHDIGDKPTAWTPAAHIDEAALEAYQAQFGPDHSAFDHGGCRFVLINNELFNSGLEAEQRQWAWLEGELGSERRHFVFCHYPPFLRARDEVEHYDNLAEPARSRFCRMLEGRAEALFSAHVHNFFFNRIDGVHAYVAPATSALRHDYTHIFPTPLPDTDFGRNLVSKLGFFLVDVYEDGHEVRFVHSWGATDAAAAAAATCRPGTAIAHGAAAPIGVHLREGWADTIAVPFSGAVDEFSRKSVRNDYLLLALQELGLKRLRIPVTDLADADYCDRLADLASLGHRFTLFGFGVPGGHLADILKTRRDHIEALEIICFEAQMTEVAGEARRLQDDLGLPVFLSKLRSSADAAQDGNQFAHFIRHGFTPADPGLARALDVVEASGLDGLVFLLPRSAQVLADVNEVVARLSARGKKAIFHVHLGDENPAREACDDAQTARIVVEATIAGWQAGERATVFLDTLCSHDRGYFPRAGLVDRKYDLLTAGQVLKRLVEFGDAASSAPTDGADFRATAVTGSDGRPLAIFSRSEADVSHIVGAEANGTPLSCYSLDAPAPAAARLERRAQATLASRPGAAAGSPLVILDGHA